jgi:hypothetical protein
MQKINPFIHMLLWGVISGFLSAFTIPLLMGAFGIDFAWDQIVVVASVYGALPGLIIGAICGGILYYFMRDIDEDNFDVQATKSRKWIPAMVFFGTVVFMLVAFSPTLFKDVTPSTIIPIMTAIIAAVATENYLGKFDRKQKNG